MELLARFDTVSYGEVWDRAGALAAALSADSVHPVRPGDRVCVLGFTGVDYTIIDIALIRMAAVAVPLQTSAAVGQLSPIIAETEPRVIAAGVDYLADAVDLVLGGPAPERLVVFDYHPEVDDQREAVEAARSRFLKWVLYRPHARIVWTSVAKVAKTSHVPTVRRALPHQPTSRGSSGLLVHSCSEPS